MVDERNATECDKLDSLDLRIVEQLIERPALTDEEIAERLGVSRQTVNRRRNSPQVHARLVQALQITEKRIRRITVKALSRLEDMLDDPDPKVRLAAALGLAKFTTSLITSTPSTCGLTFLEEKKQFEVWSSDDT